MGRPLYSRAFRTAPVVRDPEPPCCEKWSYLNAFDPDSDSFFDSDNAVYEDFIDPVTSVNSVQEVEDDEEQDMLVVRMGNASPISSEGSLSDGETVGTEDAAHLVADAFDDIRHIDDVDLVRVEPTVRVRLATRPWLGEVLRGSQTTDSGRPHPRRAFASAAIRTVSYHPYPQRDESLPMPTPSAPIPVPTVTRRMATIDERLLSSPSTPPRQTPLAHISMSPPPTSTPRLYTWARNPTHSSSPSSSGPFTNPHARTSYAHLSPALIRIRDVTV